MQTWISMAMALALAGCGALQPGEASDEKDVTKPTKNPRPTQPCIPDDEATDGAASKGKADDDESQTPAPNAAADKLPFDVAAGLALKPAPRKPCNPKPTPTPTTPALTPMSAEACAALGLLDRAAPEPNAGAPASLPQQTQTGGVCASDATQAKNVAPAGTLAAAAVNWKVLPGLLDFGQANAGCAALGLRWHLAEPAELAQVFLEPGFRTPAELDCLNDFWTGPARLQGGVCSAQTRGFRFSAGTSALPFEAKPRDESNARVAVAAQHLALCVEGRAKPEAACGAMLEQLFAANPLGVFDRATGMTWARITVTEHVTAAAVETQCALGAAQGWRIPTAVELEAAIKGDVFRTAAYGGKDLTCRSAWHKSEKPSTARTCAGLGVGIDGGVSFFEDEACAAAGALGVFKVFVPEAGAPAPTDPLPEAPNPTPTKPAPAQLPFGLCVKAKA